MGYICIYMGLGDTMSYTVVNSMAFWLTYILTCYIFLHWGGENFMINDEQWWFSWWLVMVIDDDWWKFVVGSNVSWGFPYMVYFSPWNMGILHGDSTDNGDEVLTMNGSFHTWRIPQHGMVNEENPEIYHRCFFWGTPPFRGNLQMVDKCI